MEWNRRNVDCPSPGRKTALILISPSRTGKMEWARSSGCPIVMSKRWILANYRDNATHVVVNDVDVRSIGGGTESYWREVFGCQESFDVCGRYRKTGPLQWELPCVWTCNADQVLISIQ